MHYRILTINDPEYPALLRETARPPRELYVSGALTTPGKTVIAIVGTRKATVEGKDRARDAARYFASQGAIVVSGLAMGIDAAAHEGALLGGGETLAVLGTGIDIIYPAQNEYLAKKIGEHGAILSEYAPGTRGLPYRFLERNRIVAGLAHALLLIEAPARSGALQTARLAAEYGRDVFVFRGSGPQYAGAAALIEDGAEAADGPEAVWAKVQISPVTQVAMRPKFLKNSQVERKTEQRKGRVAEETRHTHSATQHLILEALPAFGYPPSIDKIAEETKLTPRVVQQEVSELLLSDIIEEVGLGFRLKR